jgi:hypothetical protein
VPKFLLHHTFESSIGLQNIRARLRTISSRWGAKPEPSLPIHAGWKFRKFPAVGEVFFLTSLFVELLGWDMGVCSASQWIRFLVIISIGRPQDLQCHF